MKIAFTKYQGAGNDFIIIDNRDLKFPQTDTSLILKMCDRRFGIGADGLILLEKDEVYDFKMIYFNADGNQSSMCGNGGRCIVAFAKELGMIQSKTNFIAIDGAHQAELCEDGQVALGMIDVDQVEEVQTNQFLLNTGSPHYVVLVKEMPEDLLSEARKIRNSERFIKDGVNINFVKLGEENTLQIRTYERGVEAETLACGTGAVAAAIVASKFLNSTKLFIDAQGGRLEVSFEPSFKKVLLKGPAIRVYSALYLV
jgi:diaminopimelate epimerase